MLSPLARDRRGGLASVATVALPLVVGALLGAAVQHVRQSVAEADASRVRAALEVKAREVALRVSSLLTGGCVLEAPPEGRAAAPDAVFFRRPAERVAGRPAEQALHRLAFEYAAGEYPDGVDNDGNGLVDDGELVLTRCVGEACEARVVLCRGLVDPHGSASLEDPTPTEPGFELALEGGLAHIGLTLQRRDPAGGVARAHVETLARTWRP